MLRGRDRGLIPTQETEVITLRNGRVADVRRVRPRPHASGWFDRLRRLFRAATPNTFSIGEAQDATVLVEASLLEGRDRFCLVEATDGRPRLNLLPGMRGEITVGAAKLSATQMLRDPGLRRAEGDSSYALPNGARARIRCGGLTFLIRCVSPTTPAYCPS